MKTASLFMFICLLGIMPVATSAPYTPNGAEVTDTNTGLIWRSCPEGMTWDGINTCTGTASVFTHEAALQRAMAQANSSGVAWRLPNVKELASIVDRSRSNPAIDPTIFPATPPSIFWSSSPFVSITGTASIVDFGLGGVGGSLRNNVPYYVRLVRAGL
ncbi:MAG: DUF1566 domain-containing protein [Gallionella sp.]